MRFLERFRGGNPEQQMPKAVKKGMSEGKKFANQYNLNDTLGLSGTDQNFFHLRIGIHSLYSKIDNSQNTVLGKGGPGGFYGVQYDTPTTARYREMVDELKTFADNYRKQNYEGNTNRANTIQQAVNMLFVQMHYGDSYKLPSRDIITAWGQEWRARLDASQNPTS